MRSVLLARTESGGWSYPAFYTMGGASVGFQVGAQASEVVLLIMNEGALSAVMKNQIKLGGDVSAAVDREVRGDPAGWRLSKACATVRRFTPGCEDEWGRLGHGGDRRWRFHYEVVADPDEAGDEVGFRFDSHAFRQGEYVSITAHDGVQRTFKVVAVG